MMDWVRERKGAKQVVDELFPRNPKMDMCRTCDSMFKSSSLSSKCKDTWHILHTR
jgi:hypothetical protein